MNVVIEIRTDDGFGTALTMTEEGMADRSDWNTVMRLVSGVFGRERIRRVCETDGHEVSVNSGTEWCTRCRSILKKALA